MPTNLPAEAKKKWDEASTARNPKQKLQLLQEFLSLVPKHKGTEKLRAQVKTKMATLRREEEEEKKRGKASTHGPKLSIEKEGAAQLVILGQTKVGRSSLLTSVTNAKAEVSNYPFTTRKPLAGMMRYENIQMQLVDTPPISTDYIEPWLFGIIRNSDGILLMVDLSEDPLEQLESTIAELKKSNIYPIGKQQTEKDEVNHTVKQTLIIANKNDLDPSCEIYNILKELYAFKFPIVSISAREEDNLDGMKKEVFQMLRIIRVYTKAPGKAFDPNTPFILKEGKTVSDLSEKIHKDFAKRFKYARIWGAEKYKGQMVQKEYVLKDGDVLELHM